ncbi:MAG TPA: phosphoenolpyruvate synthase [Gammaproteobacteria bacterium]|nr:phosphoenolpyruvate synthase [Gammaproteobacteria bacterium]
MPLATDQSTTNKTVTEPVSNRYIRPLQELGMESLAEVGGKNASLGEMIKNLAEAGVNVPGGYATTAQAFREFLAANGLDKEIEKLLQDFDVNNVNVLDKTAKEIRQLIINTPFHPELEDAIIKAYESMRFDDREPAVAIRSSATAEDLPDASFAGQQETFLNVRGKARVLLKVKEVFSSLYNNRAIAYRVHKEFKHGDVALSAGIQQMVRSDIGTSGVMFTIDTESGFRDTVFITANYGLGETVVQGTVNPDEYYVYKPALESGKHAILSRAVGSKKIKMVYEEDDSESGTVKTVDVDEDHANRFCLQDSELEELARQAVVIEKHYDRPMDIEWAIDGETGKIFIVQARPETVLSSAHTNVIERYQIKKAGNLICQGAAIGQRIGSGKARLIMTTDDMHVLEEGDVLVTEMTDPDWEPIMKKAAAIVTDRGGRTCHAAIIARELGVPAVVGCGDASEKIKHGDTVTVSCAEGKDGHIYAGEVPFDVKRIELDDMPKAPVKIMMNVGNPEKAMSFAAIPNEGVGLARLEFIINNRIGVHPQALLEFDQQEGEVRKEIEKRIHPYGDPVGFYVDKLAEGIATIGAAFAPKPVIVRLSDFKSNEYANLVGGERYEPDEENPMIGFRGTSRYLSPDFEPCFELECRALRFVREEMGLENVIVMVPFVRTLGEARAVTELLAKYGLKRGEKNLKLIMMCEIPGNSILADEFLEYFDGFSIGSNDMTQMTLALDRDSSLVGKLFDERDGAVKFLLSRAIQACRNSGKYIGICGQAPSDYPDMARWLVDEGIESISLNPDTVIDTWLYLAGVDV